MKRLSYPVSGEKTFSANEFADPVDVPIGFTAPRRDTTTTGHTGRCLVCSPDDIFNIWNCAGTWHLRLPLDVGILMPGTTRRINSVSSLGGSQWSYGTSITTAFSILFLIGDQTEIFSSGMLSHKTIPDLAENKFGNLNINLDQTGTLDVVLQQQMSVLTGWAAHHDLDITIGYSYMSDVPPAQGGLEIRLISLETNNPVSNASVRLMQGAVIKAQGITDNIGDVSWLNVDEGDYTLHVLKIPPGFTSGGYEELFQPITVVPNYTSSHTLKLVPIPPLTLEAVPWYYWAGLGIVAVGGLYIVFRPKRSSFTFITSPLRRLGRQAKAKAKR